MHMSPIIQDAAPRMLRIDQVLQRTGLGRTATYELIARGLHPAPVKVGRCSMWLDREITDWIEQLAVQRGLQRGVPSEREAARKHGAAYTFCHVLNVVGGECPTGCDAMRHFSLPAEHG